MELLQHLKNTPIAKREKFARKCGTTLGYLLQVAYKRKHCGEALAINIDRETRGVVSCEELNQKADWAYIRKSRHVARKSD